VDNLDESDDRGSTMGEESADESPSPGDPLSPRSTTSIRTPSSADGDYSLDGMSDVSYPGSGDSAAGSPRSGSDSPMGEIQQ
jgi:hypothetical protein